MSKICPIWHWFDDTDQMQINKPKLCNSKLKFTEKSNSNLHKHMQNADDIACLTRKHADDLIILNQFSLENWNEFIMLNE